MTVSMTQRIDVELMQRTGVSGAWGDCAEG